MNNNTYIGRRYIPKIVGDWDNTKNTEYESLSVVYYSGNSYTSKQDVPKGIDILNTIYWVKSADFNVQLDNYRQDYLNNKTATDDNITALSEKVDTDKNEIDEQFLNIASKNLHIVYLENFGGKNNDTTTDNSQPFINAVSFLLSHGGGILQLLEGVYTFKTPISFSVPFSSIKIQGVGIFNGTNGTKIDWIGTGYLLTLNNGGQYYEINNLYVDCHSNYGFLLKKGVDQNNFKSRLKDIFIHNALRSIDLDDYIYFFMENIIIGCSDILTERGIKIGSSSGTSEFIYIEKCSIDGYQICNCDGLIINDGNNIYIDKCDIANWGNGKAINLVTEYEGITLDNICIRDCNIIRSDGGLYIEAKNASITQILIDKLSLLFKGLLDTEKGIYSIRQSTYSILGLNMKNLDFRKLGSINPTNVVYINDSSVSGGVCDIESNLTAGNVYLGGIYSQIKYIDNSFRTSKLFTVSADGVATSFTITLSSKSPFSNTPSVIVNTDKAIAFGKTVSNTLNGDLTATINFASAPPIGNIRIDSFITSQGSN